MKIESLVCAFDQGEKLKELGVDQISLFWHWTDYDGYGSGGPRMDSWNNGRAPVCSAYNVAELGEMMKGYEMPYYWKVWEEFCYEDGTGNPKGYQFEAHARAAKLIWLIKTKRITVEQVNERLKKPE